MVSEGGGAKGKPRPPEEPAQCQMPDSKGWKSECPTKGGTMVSVATKRAWVS